MKKIIRNFPVFVTLLFVGIGIIGLYYFLMPEYKQALSIFIGVLSGLVVIYFEAFATENGSTKYKPTLLPYIIFYLSILLSGITFEAGGFIAISPGAYLITLALAFKIYEFKTKSHWITWVELLDK